jgi:hypothetical protein
MLIKLKETWYHCCSIPEEDGDLSFQRAIGRALLQRVCKKGISIVGQTLHQHIRFRFAVRLATFLGHRPTTATIDEPVEVGIVAFGQKAARPTKNLIQV